MFDKLIANYKIHKVEKLHNQKRNLLIKEDKENELIIHHYRGCERGGLGLISYDLNQLKELQKSLESRGYGCMLLDDYTCGNRDFKFNLISRYKNDKNIKDSMNFFLDFVEKYFVNGRPIPNFDFFNDKEKDILNKWW